MTETVDKLGAHEVAAWLRRHPGFLKQFPDLALTMVVPRDDGPTASLASYQLEVLRDKNRELNRRLQELFGNAQENERLAVRTHQLTLALMRQTSAADTLRAAGELLGVDPWQWVLTGGEDHTLIGTIDGSAPVGFRSIGTVTRKSGVRIDGEARTTTKGWESF